MKLVECHHVMRKQEQRTPSESRGQEWLHDQGQDSDGPVGPAIHGVDGEGGDAKKAQPRRDPDGDQQPLDVMGPPEEGVHVRPLPREALCGAGKANGGGGGEVMMRGQREQLYASAYSFMTPLLPLDPLCLPARINSWQRSQAKHTQ